MGHELGVGLVFLSAFLSLSVPVALATSGKAYRGVYFALTLLVPLVGLSVSAVVAAGGWPLLSGAITLNAGLVAVSCLFGGILYRKPEGSR